MYYHHICRSLLSLKVFCFEKTEVKGSTQTPIHLSNRFMNCISTHTKKIAIYKNCDHPGGGKQTNKQKTLEVFTLFTAIQFLTNLNLSSV